MPDNNLASEAGPDMQISDLIENAPSWLLRSGISTLFGVVVLFVGLTAFIRYPDKVMGKGIITTDVPPVALLTLEEGRIAQLFVQHNDTVLEHDLILFIANDASLTDVAALRQELNQLKNAHDHTDYSSTNLPALKKLGMMQGNYLQMKQQCEVLKLLVAQSELQALQQNSRAQEVNRIRQLNQSLVREKALFRQELDLKEKDYQRQKTLHDSKAISPLEYEKNRGVYLQFQRQYEGMESGIVNNQIRITQLQTEEIKRGAEYRQKIEATIIDIQQIVVLLESELKVWEKRYFIKAETAGVIAFASNMEHNTFLPIRSLVGYIIPTKPGNLLTKISVPVHSSGKIEKGQKMILKTSAFPYKEYGILTTEIEAISTIALMNPDGQEYYEIRGRLSSTLISSYGKQLPYKPNMQVTAEIISENKSLFHRIFNQFFDLLKNG